MSVRYYNYNLHNTAESAGGVDGASVRAGLRAATCWSEHSTVTVIVTSYTSTFCDRNQSLALIN